MGVQSWFRGYIPWVVLQIDACLLVQGVAPLEMQDDGDECGKCLDPKRIVLTRGSPARLRAYVGTSMAGVLRAGDQVLCSGVPFHMIAPGDVIVFSSADGAREIVHRVVGRLPGGLKTRGDRSCRDDRELVTVDRYVGCVREVVRGPAVVSVAGGFRGLATQRLLHLRTVVWEVVAVASRPFRHMLGDGQWIALIAALPGARLVRYGTSDADGTMKLIWRGRVLARRERKSPRWHFG